MAILAANDFKQIVLVVEMQGRDSSSHDFVVLVFQGLAMSLITSILYPVDFSPSSVAMAAYVKRAAALLGARASLLHVVDPTGYNALQLYVRPISEVSEEYLGIGRERLNSFLTAEFPRGAVPKNPDFGDAATEIARVAREERFDLIIMPTHSGIFRRMLLGSTGDAWYSSAV
jgi:nucleotide-binding universal stress UspA family protein